jgi:chromosome segregation protein
VPRTVIQFERLRLSGFKSFVDPVEVPISPGMTGIVGPNGCGKSNLVEALTWVMGETSARQMRGAEMDDVIFGGSATRPSRNLAEAVLVLDNKDRNAPAQFNDTDTIEVLRRIDRGRGSTYRVNGKEVRAKDVHILFADASAGPRSPAIINQGRVGALISSKATDRRSLLEEAAGIGGLHARRHEAELRLRAAEANLTRLEDVVGALANELTALKRQARQASRYRNLTEHIRDAEIRLLAARWTAAAAALAAALESVTEAEREVETLTGLAAEAGTRQVEAAAQLPELRRHEAEAAAVIQRLAGVRERLDAEEERIAGAQRELNQRLAQLAADLDREAALSADATRALSALAEERDALLSARAGHEEREAEARIAADEAAATARSLQGELDIAVTQAAAIEAERAAAQRALGEASGRHARLAARAAELTNQLDRARAEIVDPVAVDAAAAELEAARLRVDGARGDTAEAERRRAEAQSAYDRARDHLRTLQGERAGLLAEAKALADLLGRPDEAPLPSLAERVIVPHEFEAALGAALGDDLSAPVDVDAPAAWRTLPPLDDVTALPEGAQPLSALIQAPDTLTRRLSQTGLVESETGALLQPRLKPGQRLVSRAGDLWRWDGYTLRAGAMAAATARLHHRNRLRDLEPLIAESQRACNSAEADVAEHAQASEQAIAGERAARDALRAAEQDFAQRREAHATLSARAVAAASRLQALTEQDTATRADLAEAEAAEIAARDAAAPRPEDDLVRARVIDLRAILAERHARQVETEGRRDRLRGEAAERDRRLSAIDAEQASWTERAGAAERQSAALTERRANATLELERLAALPAALAEQRAALRDETLAAEDRRRIAASALADGEQTQTAADRAVREAEHALAAAREERVRREGSVATCREGSKGIAERIAERLDLSPEDLMALPEAQEPGDLAEVEARWQKLTRERDGMGPVNLRAEEEAAELEKRIADLNAERDDLVAAIARLRRGIGELNQEGRQRLLDSFETVNRQFTILFTRLFGGGRAHLTLTESEDPLEAGLEIMASPPGKKLQVLSLLSGGEQALTALALLFAVFMANPAPVCVLDEVDAPLDDANVDRFCTMVQEIAQAVRTRFLLVTHHRMTMARVDRLFGVTMAERGVSTLVSVDLDTAEMLRERA